MRHKEPGRRTLTAGVPAEIKVTPANAQLVAAEGIPDVPFYSFISNGDEPPVDNWGEILAAYAEAARGQYSMLDVGHYVHSEAAGRIADESRTFLQQIER